MFPRIDCPLDLCLSVCLKVRGHGLLALRKSWAALLSLDDTPLLALLSVACRGSCWLITCLLATSLTAIAQLPPQNDVLVLDSWRMHTGDNIGWARSEVDDSHWQRADAPRRALGLAIVEDGYRWYRATVVLPSALVGRDLAIGMGPASEVYEIYVDGVSIGRFGRWLPGPASPFDRNLAFVIPPAVIRGPVVHIAIRAWTGKTSTGLFPFYISGASRFIRPPELGVRSTVDDRTLLYTYQGIVRNLPWNICLFSMGVAGCIALVLFSAQHDHKEYLLLGIYGVGSALDPLVGGILAASDSVMRRSIAPVIVAFFYVFFLAAGLAFLARLTPHLRRWLSLGAVIYSLSGLAAAYGMYTQAGYTNMAFWSIVTGLPIFFFFVGAIGLFLERKPGSFAIAVSLLLFQLATAWVNFTGNFAENLLGVPDLRYMPLGPFTVDIRAVFQLFFVLVTLIVLCLRYREDQFHQVALERDMASARQMQEMLLGHNSTPVDGFAVEAVYLPAHEVGGDFYRTVPFADGSLLVVVGDVSGKGLNAAMLVAAVLGSLANETHRNPASLLGYLNRAVSGRTGGGFITACCARLYPEGRIVVANAGHIAPYLNNRELQVESGLPLGVTLEASYSETEVEAAGTLTFISDGVVEARDKSGRLLGFDRMVDLTSQSATEIANVAQRWGQEDDITVLRVCFAVVEAEPATDAVEPLTL